MSDNKPKLDELHRELKEAETQFESATGGYEQAREAAVLAIIRSKNTQYCVTQGLLVPQDDPYIESVARQAQQSRSNLARARRQLTNATQRVSDLRTSIERVEKEVLAAQQRAWVKKHRPEVLSELEAATNACHELFRSRTEGTTGHAQRVLRAQERRNHAQAAYDAACAESQ